MARPIASDHHDKRLDLLNRAAVAFARHGYPSCSMQQLASACSVSKATLYHYYPNKDALLFDLLERHTRSLLELLPQPPSAQPSDAKAQLHALVRSYLGAYAQARERHLVLLHDVQFLPEAERNTVLARERQIVASFTGLIDAAYPQAQPSTEANGRARTMLLLGAMNWTFTWLRPDGPMRYADFADMLIRTLESGFNNA
jgi:AcrR family transcriptional regulator